MNIVKGLLCPFEWDAKGYVTKIAIFTSDEKCYQIEKNQKEEELFSYIKKRVEVSGEMEICEEEIPKISVSDFKLI